MKVNGREMTGPRIVKVYLMTGDDVAVEFKFRALKPDEDFEKVMPKPKPRKGLKPGGQVVYETESPVYKEQLTNWVSMKFDYQFLKSISETDGLEWATVKMEDPSTYTNWKTEVESAFSVAAINKIFEGYVEAQHITEESLEAARQSFLTSRREAELSQANQSLSDALTSGLSGELVNE